VWIACHEFTRLRTWHKPTELASARALRALEPRLLVVGHGGMLAEPLPAIDGATCERQVREAAAHGA
jgi:hypothetical protein